MIALNNEYKVEVAKECTLLAIQHGLIRIQVNSESTASEVTKFFQSVFDNLDSKAKAK